MTQASAERAAAFEAILRPALMVLADRDSDPGGIRNARATLARITGLIDRFHGIDPGEYAERSLESPVLHDARARARTATRRHRLVHDILSVAELVTRIVAEAEAIITGRLQAMVADDHVTADA